MSKQTRGKELQSYHNNGEKAAAREASGKGSSSAPGSFDFTDGLLMSSKTFEDRTAFEKGKENHRSQTKR